jgi:hypothetical protein
MTRIIRRRPNQVVKRRREAVGYALSEIALAEAVPN